MLVWTVALMLQAASTAPAPPPTQDDITVTARKETRRVATLLRSLLHEADGEQLSRFETGICPGVSGVNGAAAETMVRLIRENIAAVGAKLKPEGCKVSGLVIFTHQPRDLVEAMYRQKPIARLMNPIRRDRMRKRDDAIRSLQFTQVRNANGTPVDVDIAAPPIVRSPFASRLTPPIRHDAIFAFAIIDSKAAAGKTIRQLADIATLHLLLDVSPDAAQKVDDSILALFVRDAPPAAMTALDRGMLVGLYRPSNNAAMGYAQRSRMATAVRKEREREQAGADR